MDTKSLQELAKHSIYNINNYENIDITWCKSCLVVRGDKTVRIYEFSHNLHRSAKNIDFFQYIIKVSIRSPASGLFDFFQKGLKGLHLSQLITDPALWPHSNNILNEIAYIHSVKWSPEGFLWNNHYILAVMNNVGHVEFYRKQRKQWSVDFELTSHIQALYKNEIQTHQSNFEMVKKLAHILIPCAMCFSSSVTDDKSVFFITAHKSGVLIFWLMKEVNKKVSATYFSQIETNCLEIVTLKWLENGSQILLFCANNMGEVNLLECDLQDSNISILKSHLLWPHKDRMAVKHCEYLLVEDKQIFFCAKHRHLLVLMLNNDCEIIGQYTHNIDDYKITGLCKYGNDIFMTTTSSLFRINYTVKDINLGLNWNIINVKSAYPTCDLVCMDISCNGTLLTLGLVDRKIMCKKETLRLEVINFATESNFSEIYLLLSNPSKRLTHFWDSIETLICNVIKMKKLPELNYEKLLAEGETDVYKLKIYLILLLLCKGLESSYKLPRNSLPENSIEFIKEKILAMHAIKVLNNLYEKYLLSNNCLTKFQTESFVGCKTFLKYYTKKYQKVVEIDTKIENLITTDVNYICQCCDENIIDFSCKEGHCNNFCSLTFTPIECNDYLTCNSCGVLARIELSNENPLCVFCNLHFYEA